MSKKTRTITYNLADRGRAHNGVDRSDLDIRSAVNRINAPDVQELVSSGDLYGYYGHELRARFGMNPPDVWVNPQTGENIRIEPALRTIELSADNDGNVTTRHEFLDTDSGKYSQRLYANNAGGFSSAMLRRMNEAGKYEVTGFAGFDYVRQPNYNTNRGDGMFDSLFWIEDAEEVAFDGMANVTPERAALMAALETAIIHQYDSMATAIHSDIMISHYQKEALSAQDLFIARQNQLANVKARQQARKEEIYDSLICPSVSFKEVAAQWDSFSHSVTSDKDLLTTESAKQARINTESREERTSLFGRRR